MKLDPGADCLFKGACLVNRVSVGLHLRLLLHSHEGVPSFCPSPLPSSRDTNVSLSTFEPVTGAELYILNTVRAPQSNHGIDTLTRRGSSEEKLKEPHWLKLCIVTFVSRNFFRAWLSVLCWTIGRFQAREWISNDARGLFGGFISVWFCRKKTPIHDPQASALVMGKLGTSCFF